MTRASLQTRLFAGALAWIVIALIVTACGLSVLFRAHLEDELERRLDADFVQLLSQLEVEPDGTLAHPRTLSEPAYARVYSGRYWQVESTAGNHTRAPLLVSRSLWEDRLGIDEKGPRLRRLNGPRGARLLALVQRVTLPGMAAPLRLTVAATLGPVDAAVIRFRVITAIALGVLALGLIAAVALQVWLGLRPLRRLRRELAMIHEARGSRLSENYPGEVAPLVNDLNAVLAHNEGLVERARRQAGDLAHALKTPLSVIGNETARMRQADDFDRAKRLNHEVEAMQRQIEWHLARTRIAGSRRAGIATPVAPVIESLRRTLQRLYGEAGRIITVDGTADPVFAGERQDLEQMVGNLMDNACKWARGVVEVSAIATDGAIRVAVVDDGPGLETDQYQAARESGRRFDERAPGWGLGLAIVTDLAETYGGSLCLERSKTLGGLAAQLRLPGFAEASEASR